MEKMNYILEIYLLQNKPELVAQYESNSPFISFNIGDIIKANTLNCTDKKETLVVKEIQQHISEIKNISITQQIAIYANKLHDN